MFKVRASTIIKEMLRSTAPETVNVRISSQISTAPLLESVENSVIPFKPNHP